MRREVAESDIVTVTAGKLSRALRRVGQSPFDLSNFDAGGPSSPYLPQPHARWSVNVAGFQ